MLQGSRKSRYEENISNKCHGKEEQGIQSYVERIISVHHGYPSWITEYLAKSEEENIETRTQHALGQPANTTPAVIALPAATSCKTSSNAIWW